jgi:hypothetical protein
MTDHDETASRVERLATTVVEGTTPPPLDLHELRRGRRASRHRGPWLAGMAATAALIAGLVIWAPWDEDPEQLDTVGPPETTAGSTTAPTTSAPTTTSTSTPFVRTPGPPTLITGDGIDLVAVDLEDLSTVVLAEGQEIASDLGVSSVRIDGVDLSPDGTTVAFAYGGGDETGGPRSSGLYEVPADGSAAPVRLDLAASNGFAEPAYSPDGRLLAVHEGSRVVVLDESRRPTGPGAEAHLRPSFLSWSPAGDRLAWQLPATRSSCCSALRADVDPGTGRITGSPDAQSLPGAPYFDGDGELRTLPVDGWQSDLDVTGRYVVTIEGTGSQQFAWRDLQDPEAPPRRFGLDLSVFASPPVAW